MTWSVSGATTINAISYVIFSDFSVKTANIVVSIDGGFKWEVTFSEDPTFYLKPLEIEGGGSASYTLPVASTFELGGIQLASDETQESGVAALPVFLNTDHQAYADMPIITESYLDQTLVSRLHFISKVDETTFEIDNETLYLHTVNGGSVNNG